MDIVFPSILRMKMLNKYTNTKSSTKGLCLWSTLVTKPTTPFKNHLQMGSLLEDRIDSNTNIIHQPSMGWKNLLKYIPDAQCMVSLPTFGLNLWNM